MTDRITYDLDADGFETERIDEIVMSGASIHLEMLSHSSAYMSIWTGYTTDDGEDETRMIRLHANPVTRAERRRILRAGQDRLVDHLRSLLPWGGSIWGVPAYKRPACAVRDWWTAQKCAGVELIVVEES